MHNSQPGHRMVLQLGGRVELQRLSVDQLYPRRVRAVDGCGVRADQLESVGPDRAGLPRPHPAPFPARLDQFRLRRHAQRSERRPVHPRSQEPRIQGRLLSVPAGDERRVSLARPHHLARRSHADRDKRRRHLHGQCGGRRFHSGPDQSDGRILRLSRSIGRSAG